MSDRSTYKSHKEHNKNMTLENKIKDSIDDRGNLDLTKQIDTLKAEKVALQKLEDEHQKLNGELRLENKTLNEEKLKILKDQDIKNDQHTCDILEKDMEIGRLMKKITEKG